MKRDASEALVRTLFEASPGAASHHDDIGHLPMHLALEHGASESLVRTFFEAYPEAVSHSGRYETLLVVDPPSDPRSHRPIPSSEQLKAVASLHDCWVTSRTADLHAREVSGLRTELESLRQAVASLKNMGLSLKRDKEVGCRREQRLGLRADWVFEGRSV